MGIITTKHYDVNGCGIFRVLRHYLRSLTMPIGYYNRGPGYKCLGLLTLLHYWGKPVSWAHVFYQKGTHFLRRILWRLRGFAQSRHKAAP